MNTRLTVADVRAQLWDLAGLSGPTDTTNPNFLNMLNEGSEKLILSGKWKGSVINVCFDSSTGFISLPPESYSVMAMTYNRCPAMTFTQFHGYQESGPGNLMDSLGWPGVLIELGDGFVTQVDIPVGNVTNLQLRLSNAADAGKVFRLFGQNGDNQPIYDLTNGVEGINLTSAFPTANTPTTPSQLFSKVTGIQAPDGLVGSYYLSYLTGSAPTQIGQYLPWETRPMYARYQTGVAEDAIRILCQRRFRLLRNETDWVVPGNLAALREVFWHLKYLNGSDDDKAQEKFDRAIYWLNNEARAFRSGANTPTNFQSWGVSGYYGYGSADY